MSKRFYSETGEAENPAEKKTNGLSIKNIGNNIFEPLANEKKPQIPGFELGTLRIIFFMTTFFSAGKSF